MANYSNTKARQSHTLPGIYDREHEVTQSIKSLGKTKIGLVGETETGKAFDPINVSQWSEFVENFGNTNPELFTGSKYPKYELPYVASELLKEAKDLTVCRVLGLSGYNAGPAWLITASNGLLGGKRQVVAVLRARGSYLKSVMYNKYANTPEACRCQYTTYDTLTYAVGEKDNSETCTGVTGYDADAVKLSPYYSIDNFGNECDGYEFGKSAMPSGDTGFYINNNNLGQFTIECYKESETEPFATYPVSLNPSDKHYILKVLGTTAENGSAPLWVESLYDVNLQNEVINGNLTQIDAELHFADVYYTSQFCGMNLVYDFLNMGQENLTKRMVGTRYLYDNKMDTELTSHLRVTPYDPKTGRPLVATLVVPASGSTPAEYEYSFDGTTATTINFSGETCLSSSSTIISQYFGTGYTSANLFVDETNQVIYVKTPAQGTIFTVRQFTDMNNKRNYVYVFYPEGLVKKEFATTGGSGYTVDIVPMIDRLIKLDANVETEAATNYNPYKRGLALLSDGHYYRLENDDIKRVNKDLNDYKSAYRHAITPWFVSQIKGDANHFELTRLFRFHTINDGTNSTFQYKVSITNVRPDEGLFDVQIRDINDSDAKPVILESKRDCCLVEGDARYIGLMFGTTDGAYPQVSKFVTVEINNSKSDEVSTSVPAGFLGYPTQIYNGLGVSGATTNDVVSPDVVYNTIYNEDIKARAQYFGLSDITGIDYDFFTFKGRTPADETSDEYLGNGFHLDCRLNPNSYEPSVDGPTISVDGMPGDWNFSTVDINSRTYDLTGAPVLSNEVTMEDSIYADKNLRKFTAYFYGGFDGWDVYRDQRTNTDEFKANKYKGSVSKSNGEGRTFERIQTSTLRLEAGAITSDYYAYLAGINTMKNRFEVDINVMATLGMDYVNQTELSHEAIDMIEDKRRDLLYVAITPDKPSGAGDSIDEMFTPAEVVDNLEASNVDSSYVCTYYPWGQYHDVRNNKYIYLSPTKDILRIMSYTDNIHDPWWAPAGTKRAKMNFTQMRRKINQDEGDTLYSGYINPILTYKKAGSYVWGQKTTYRQSDEVQLTRISVRRLMIELRLRLEAATLDLVFDPNDPTLLKEFKDAVSPILNDFKSGRAISDYYFKATNDGATTADRRDIVGKIAIKPYPTAEYFDLDYFITPEGVSFENI